jgi:hypothetical protein
MPMRDAAQVACVSKAFVRSWRCHPNLHFSKETLGLNKRNNFLAAIAISNNPGHASVSDTGGRHMSSGDQLLNEWKYQNGEISRELNTLVDRILRNHICIGVKSLKFCFPSPVHNKDGSHLNHLETLLSTIVKPGIEELHLLLPMDAKYNFPCSLLSGGTGHQLRCLFLACCHFHPAVGLGCLRSLTILKLTMVNITSRQLGCLLSGSFALEQLELRHCHEIVHLKIPCLKKLSHLEVVYCNRLRAIESKAPNLSSVCFEGDLQVQLSLGETWRIKKFKRSCDNFVFYARTELPSRMPNLEALTIRSYSEVCTLLDFILAVHLKYIEI